MDGSIKKWLGWGLLNLAIVALYGVTMRYKIAFDFPFFDQKNLLHAHSHFAFSGWISQVLYAGLMWIGFPYLSELKRKKYHWLMAWNLIASFGMLIAFTIQGYKAISISFSTLSIVIAVAFAIVFIKDLKCLPKPHPAKRWSIVGLLLNVVSAVGPLFLAYMMATKNIDHNYYLGSVYYYLHFQYSGWFFFGSMAIMVNYLPANFPSLNKNFNVFAATVIPTFFLSILWAQLPNWLYIITVLATFLQLITWLFLLMRLFKYFKPKAKSAAWFKWFFYVVALALTLKFALQAVSVVPSLSQLVFGFRPIVIAYLHLVLLGVYSLFLLGFLFEQKVIQPSKTAKLMAFVFMFGVLLNELFLGIQGVASFAYIAVPMINELLFGAAVVLLLGAAGMFVAKVTQRKSLD
ncbi:MAG: hypothetical protein REI64_18090 [Pedobacter sp.]|uniref:hypothetical protein n=1 Tax=Pedobacter sp. TaxID=1411316 RepID=UPI00280890F7|nr:hypothetical protein [Pedobacter sp.]MDQ8006721.1 hypothetical protein [Pedobacter sp.]